MSPQLAFFPESEVRDFYRDGPHPVTPESIGTLLGYLHSLARLPLTPEALAETFGPKGEIAQGVIGSLGLVPWGFRGWVTVPLRDRLFSRYLQRDC